MIDRESAKQLVLKLLNKSREEARYKCWIVDSSTIELENAWVFFYESRKFLETGDPKWRFGGNSPVIVEKSTGKYFKTGTAHSIEFYIKNYLEYGTPHPERLENE